MQKTFENRSNYSVWSARGGFLVLFSALLALIGYIHLYWLPHFETKAGAISSDTVEKDDIKLFGEVGNAVQIALEDHLKELHAVENELINLKFALPQIKKDAVSQIYRGHGGAAGFDIVGLAQHPGVLDAFFLDIIDRNWASANNLLTEYQLWEMIGEDSTLFELHNKVYPPPDSISLGDKNRLLNRTSNGEDFLMLIRSLEPVKKKACCQLIGLILDKEWLIERIEYFLNFNFKMNPGRFTQNPPEAYVEWVRKSEYYSAPDLLYNKSLGVFYQGDNVSL